MPAATGMLQKFERRAGGSRVRVICVIDERRAAELLDVRSHRRDGHRLDAARRALRRNPQLASDAEREHGVSQIMNAAEGHADVHALDSDSSAAIGLELPMIGAHIAMLEASRDHPSCTRAGFSDDLRLTRGHNCRGDAITRR